MPKISAATVAEHREHTYEALLDATEQLVAERGVEAVSVREVAARAGVARTAVYNYAPDRVALLTAVVERRTAGLRAQVAAVAGERSRAPRERMAALVELLLVTALPGAQQLASLRAIATALTPEQRRRVTAPLREDVVARFAQVIDDGVEAGDYEPSPDPALRAEMVAGVLLVVLDALDEGREPQPGMTTTVTTFVLGALGAR